jgi:hypothetical protein
MRDSPRWLRVFAAAGIAWSVVTLGSSLFSDHSPRSLTLAISIEASGVYTLLLYLSRSS